MKEKQSWDTILTEEEKAEEARHMIAEAEREEEIMGALTEEELQEEEENMKEKKLVRVHHIKHSDGHIEKISWDTELSDEEKYEEALDAIEGAKELIAYDKRMELVKKKKLEKA